MAAFRIRLPSLRRRGAARATGATSGGASDGSAPDSSPTNAVAFMIRSIGPALTPGRLGGMGYTGSYALGDVQWFLHWLMEIAGVVPAP